jgi:hypothetical protein
MLQLSRSTRVCTYTHTHTHTHTHNLCGSSVLLIRTAKLASRYTNDNVNLWLLEILQYSFRMTPSISSEGTVRPTFKLIVTDANALALSWHIVTHQYAKKLFVAESANMRPSRKVSQLRIPPL